MKHKLTTYFWSALTMIVALAVTLYTASKQKVYVEQQGISSPDVSAPPIILYFFGVVLVTVIVLFLIPVSKLKYVFRVLFTVMYGWGMLIIIFLVGPDWLAWTLAVIAAAAWLFVPRVWVQDIVLLIALSAAGSVFGYIFSPKTFMIFMGVIAVYDLLAVRFGLMVWMADRMSETTSLPAFIYPKKLRDWNMKLSQAGIGALKEKEPEEREYSILGGGDIGFPLMLAVAVFFKYDMAAAWFVGGFALIGLMMAYVIQTVWLKEKPMPALPPIAAFSFIGWLIAAAVFG